MYVYDDILKAQGRVYSEIQVSIISQGRIAQLPGILRENHTKNIHICAELPPWTISFAPSPQKHRYKSLNFLLETFDSMWVGDLF